MRESLDLNAVAAVEDLASDDATSCSDTSNAHFRSWPAGNDATCSDALRVTDQVAQRAPYTFAVNGVDLFDMGDATSHLWPISYAAYQDARVRRAAAVHAMIVAALRAARAFARKALARHRQRQQAQAIRDALDQLDDRTLHDLGFDRLEIASVAAEATGQAEVTRLHASSPT